MLTFKILSLLLRYPTAEIHAALPELAMAIKQDRLVPSPARQALFLLVDELRNMDLITLQERYVELFDRGRKFSLHIFEHTHGESRDRGPAMVHLMTHYQDCGYQLDARELPDYLPLILEFLSERPLPEAMEMLGETAPVLTLLGARLQAQDSAYAAIFEVLEMLVGAPEEAEELRRQAAEEGPDEAVVNMDRIWEEEAVTFTQESALKSRNEGGGAEVQPIRWVAGGQPDKGVNL